MGERLRLAGIVALLALGALGGGGGTQAGWADARTTPGTTLHTGRIDLQVDGQDAVSGFAPFSLTGLEPGGSAARTLIVRNAGTVPMTWTTSVTATGANDLATTLTRTLTDAGTTDGSTCGGRPLDGSGTLAPGATDTVCVEVGLPADAPTAVAGATALLTLAATGSTVRGGWTDTATVAGSGIATTALTAPAIGCAATGAGTVDITWDPVPGATGYRVEPSSLLGGPSELAAGMTGYTFAGVAGTVTVRAEFGSSDWVSDPSNELTFSALTGVLGTCSG